MDGSAERKAVNEAAFRDANERLEAGADGLLQGEPAAFAPFLCECPQPACRQVVLVTLAEYRQVRAHENRAITADGHEDPSIERVVERNDRFVVTEKFGRAEDVFVREQGESP